MLSPQSLKQYKQSSISKLPHSSMTNKLPVSSTSITHMSYIVCTHVSLLCLHLCFLVLLYLSLPVCLHLYLVVCHHLILLLWHVAHLIITFISFNNLMSLLVFLKFQMRSTNRGNTCYLNSVLQCLFTMNYSILFLLQTLNHHHKNVKTIYRKQKKSLNMWQISEACWLVMK